MKVKNLFFYEIIKIQIMNKITNFSNFQDLENL